MIAVPGIHVPAACKHTHVNVHENVHEIGVEYYVTKKGLTE
jgi:hypothetical protein